ncbi:MAG: DUF6600 domain-containing protein [Janthinobacterium lividum]
MAAFRNDKDLAQTPGQPPRLRVCTAKTRVLSAALMLASLGIGLGIGLEPAAAQDLGVPLSPVPTGYPGQSTGNPPDDTQEPAASAPSVTSPGTASGTASAATSTAASSAAGDPPSRVARISVLQGNVSAEPASVNTFSPAERNGVLTTGDRVYTDAAAEAELQAGQLAVRLGGGTDLSVTALTDTLGQFGLAAGSVHLRSFAIDPGTVLELDSPEAAITVLQPGDVRVDVDAAAHTTTVSLLSGQVQVDGPGSSQVLTPGQSVRLHGILPESGQEAYTEPLAPAAADALDGFSDNRDTSFASGLDADSPYLNADTIGGADLAGFGAWDTSDAGPVWFPAVAVDWQPYRFGHWRWVPPWGWTWVGVEPWGFAPFHYGRWVTLHGRWGWIPGSPVVRPLYAPALVVFAGGAQFSASLGYAPGVGIAAWFPLGAHEPYTPWYHGSTLYLNRVNASNIYDPNAAEVRGLYNQRAVNGFTGTTQQNRIFANRLQGTVAVPQTAFAAGLGVNHALLHLDADALAAAPVLPHPLIAPERSMLVPQPARALPPVLVRPALTSSAVSTTQDRDGGAVLVHRANPPAPRPSFEQQREAMDRNEPGRPLSPAQMETLRPARPAPATQPRETPPRAPAGRAAEPAKAAPVTAPTASRPH